MDSLSNVLRQPTAKDDKYSRGVVGFITGSIDYPGAALLGVTAALRTGIGMVRYLGPDSVARMLIEVRPEVVLQPGRVQAWVFGSGVADDAEQQSRIIEAESGRVLAVVDARALDFVDFDSELCHSILTPHAGEMVRLLSRFGIAVSREEI
ncbi:MAG: NAD(P)H-hydrate dehydratase, partial [Rhodoluna sp.]